MKLHGGVVRAPTATGHNGQCLRQLPCQLRAAPMHACMHLDWGRLNGLQQRSSSYPMAYDRAAGSWHAIVLVSRCRQGSVAQERKEGRKEGNRPCWHNVHAKACALHT